MYLYFFLHFKYLFTSNICLAPYLGCAYLMSYSNLCIKWWSPHNKEGEWQPQSDRTGFQNWFSVKPLIWLGWRSSSDAQNFFREKVRGGRREGLVKGKAFTKWEEGWVWSESVELRKSKEKLPQKKKKFKKSKENNYEIYK